MLLGNMFTSADWIRLRNKAYERDGYKCQTLGDCDAHLGVHHKIRPEHGGKQELDNLVTVCNRCHKLVENKRIGKEMLKRLAERGLDENWFYNRLEELGIKYERKIVVRY